MPQTKRQKQQKVLDCLEKEYLVLEKERMEFQSKSSHYIMVNYRQSMILNQIVSLKRKLNIDEKKCVSQEYDLNQYLVESEEFDNTLGNQSKFYGY